MKKLLDYKLAILLTLFLGAALGWSLKSLNSEGSEHSHEVSEGKASLWTCSMHPNVKLPEAGACPICGMDLIPANIGPTSDDSPMALQMTPEALAMAQVQTIVVGEGSATKDLTLTGKIQADERENASMTAKFPGRIEKLYVTFTGEQVKAGQKLATVYSPELMTAQKELLEAARTKATFPQLYQASKEKLALWKLSSAQVAEIERAGVVKEKWDILADQSGVVVQKNVAVGDYVSTGSVLFTVTNLNKLWLLLDVYESDLSSVSLGDEIQYTVAGRPGEPLIAKVSFINPLLNSETRAASLRAEIPNVGNALKPEMFVTARLNNKNPQSTAALVVPRTAVLWSGKRSVVYVKVPNSSVAAFEMREVQVSQQGEDYRIESGLSSGEEIASQGVFAIDASAQLSGKSSMMSRPAASYSNVTAEFSAQITEVVTQYFKLKNALVKDQLAPAKSAGNDLFQVLAKVQSSNLKGAEKTAFAALNTKLRNASFKIKDSKDLTELRKQFELLSTEVILLTERFGLNQDLVYKDYCPMAFNNKGAYWLSERKEITNPYFGASMLTCGEVK
ncbi:MAG: efflux RND transporter periplasmic adaptor subunit, partial [Bacteroidetes bacterium]|nr:efflux RND transporter periplasmic adaptor subunit [Bacteroidota bacterium]